MATARQYPLESGTTTTGYSTHLAALPESISTMRCVVQRVSEASVTVDQQIVGQIEAGLMVLVGVGPKDSESEVSWMADKLIGLRIFEDAEGKMNLSLLDNGGSLLLVSQFTLYGDCKKGKRPSFIGAAPPELAEKLYDKLAEAIQGRGVTVATGQFRTEMQVSLINSGPVTLIVESP